MPLIKWFLALALALGSVAAAAQRQGSEGRYTHRGSQMIAPNAIEGMNRSEIRDLSGTDRDVMIHYRTADNSNFLTVYFYRSPHRSAALWFEQARRALEANPVLGGALGSRPVVTFATPGATSPDGLLVSYKLGDQFRSTAVAVATVGNWIVKLRMTSSTLDEDALSQRVIAAAQALGWPQRQADAAAAIAPCAERLPAPTEARSARAEGPARTEAQRRLVATAHGAELPALCFDRQEGLLGVYRESGENGYLLALGDNGRFARVRQVDANASGLYAVEFYDLNAAYLAGFFRGMPTPEQALQASDAAYRAQADGVAYLETEIRADQDGAVPVT
jgi:hypothetical protein